MREYTEILKKKKLKHQNWKKKNLSALNFTDVWNRYPNSEWPKIISSMVKTINAAVTVRRLNKYKYTRHTNH